MAPNNPTPNQKGIPHDSTPTTSVVPLRVLLDVNQRVYAAPSNTTAPLDQRRSANQVIDQLGRVVNWQGAPHRLVPVTTPHVVLTAQFVLTSKLGVTPEQARRDVLAFVELVVSRGGVLADIPQDHRFAAGSARVNNHDPEDEHVIADAQSTNSIVITADNGFLEHLEDRHEAAGYHPEEFLEMIRRTAYGPHN